MQNLNPHNISKADWDHPKQTVIDYHHQSTHSSLSSTYGAAPSYPPFSYNSHLSYGMQPNKVPPPSIDNLEVQYGMHPFNTMMPPQAHQFPTSDESGKVNKIDHLTVQESRSYHATVTKDVCLVPKKYDPFVEDKLDDMDISDDEKPSQKLTISAKQRPDPSPQIHASIEVNSGASFYKGLILYIPPFEQIANTYKGSPAMKMLYASFEFSFKMPIRIETKPKENIPNM